jgi:hypothetical protein
VRDALSVIGESKIATHEEPAARDRSNYIVRLDLTGDGMPGHYEQMWTRTEEKLNFELCCIPFFTYGLSLRDSFAITGSDGAYRVVSKGGHRTIRIAVQDQGEPPEIEVDRVLTTILFTDIVGSTERAAQEGDHRWGQILEAHHRAVRAELRRYRGVESDTAGDGFFATFDGPARAIRCACAIRDSVRAAGVEIRAGSTRARSRSSETPTAAWGCTSAPASVPRPGPARCSSPGRSSIWSSAPESRSPSAVSTSSRASPDAGSSSRSTAELRMESLSQRGGSTPYGIDT